MTAQKFQEIQSNFQAKYSGTRVGWDARTGIRILNPNGTISVVADTFPWGIRTSDNQRISYQALWDRHAVYA